MRPDELSGGATHTYRHMDKQDDTEAGSAARATSFAIVHTAECEPCEGEETESDGNAELVHEELPRYVANAAR
jgi:hypothetical protein